MFKIHEMLIDFAKESPIDFACYLLALLIPIIFTFAAGDWVERGRAEGILQQCEKFTASQPGGPQIKRQLNGHCIRVLAADRGVRDIQWK